MPAWNARTKSIILSIRFHRSRRCLIRWLSLSISLQREHDRLRTVPKGGFASGKTSIHIRCTLNISVKREIRFGRRLEKIPVLTWPRLIVRRDGTDQGRQHFGRMAPDEKQRLIQALPGLNEHVAVKGDGADDAPALKYPSMEIAIRRGRGAEWWVAIIR